MAVNRGKKFESVIEQCFNKVADTSVVRLHDQTTGFKGSTNPCDFLIYNRPYMYAIECKTVHKSSLPIYSRNPKKKYGNISNYQWESLLQMSTVKGVRAGIICWWIDKDVTLFLPIQILKMCRDNGWKSINYKKALSMQDVIEIKGRKKRVFFDYDMSLFFHATQKRGRRK